MNNFLMTNPKKETIRIVNFLKKTLHDQKIKNVVIGLSGGIDSTVSYYLLKKVLPIKNIYPVHLPYAKPSPLIPKNIPIISIQKTVDLIEKTLMLEGKNLKLDKEVLLGNIMARTRMIILFDLAKKYNALVCGTENRSEHLLGYFTRFGDGASDIEPIRHLYKTQIYQLASYLKVPQDVINQPPSAGLWKGQTDENEFGFTYEEADQVLHLYFDQRKNIAEIKKIGLIRAQKIIDKVNANTYKHLTPYHVD